MALIVSFRQLIKADSMSTRQYTISGDTADGTYELNSEMSQFFERGYAAFRFYSDPSFQNLVTPTAGTVTFEVSETGAIYGSVGNGTNIPANTIGPAVKYPRPNWLGSTRKARVILAGITGAAYFKCTIYRFEG